MEKIQLHRFERRSLSAECLGRLEREIERDIALLLMVDRDVPLPLPVSLPLPLPPRSQESTDDIVRQLECIICNKPCVTRPILGCRQNGHIVCKFCASLSNSCGLCRDPIMDCRQSIAEYVIGTTFANALCKCPLHTVGCEEQIQLGELENHVKNCRYQLVGCPGFYQQKCTWHGALRYLEEHLQNCEGVIVSAY